MAPFLAAFGLTACKKNPCAHVYDNACDAICNVCTEERTITHAWQDATCTAPKTCSVCGETEGEKLGHTTEDDDGDCTTAVYCLVCDEIAVEAKEDHTDLDGDGYCDDCQTILFDYIYDQGINTYMVWTLEGLYAWMTAANTAVNGEVHLVLMRDIVMPTEMKFDLNEDGTNESNWKPLMDYHTVVKGNGHKITGLVCIERENYHAGFFGYLAENGEITDLHLENVYVESVEGGYAGGIVGACLSSVIKNCSVSGTVKANGYVGGIIGYVDLGSEIIGCHNAADVQSSENSAGGITGVACSENTKILACSNVGNIQGVGFSGGIAGEISDAVVLSCYSTGTVQSSYDESLGMSCVGGIAGWAITENIFFANYWNTSGDSPTYGNGFEEDDEGCLKVDGETRTWESALTTMNAALAEYGGYCYVLNTDEATKATKPLIFVEKSEA